MTPCVGFVLGYFPINGEHLTHWYLLTKWHNRIVLKLVQVISWWCLMAPSHYLNQQYLQQGASLFTYKKTLCLWNTIKCINCLQNTLNLYIICWGCFSIDILSYQYRNVIPNMKVRQSPHCLAFIKGTPIPGKMIF